MAQITYRANLSSAIYPMTIAEGGRTVIIPGPDNNFDRRVDPTGAQKDAGIPQALYLENVMPTASGYQSVGYLVPDSRPMTVPPGATYIKYSIEIPVGYIPLPGPGIPPTDINSVPLFIWDNDTYTAGYFGDRDTSFVAAPAGVTSISSAVVRGVCYVFMSTPTGNYLFDVTTDTLDTGIIVFTDLAASITPPGQENGFIAICGSSNYLVGASSTTVYYSSTTTPTDFVGSLVSGAGEINPNDSNNLIQYLKETAGGFYAYCSTNTLYAQYTGNSRYPWRFTAVTNSTGLLQNSPWCLAGGIDTDGHYVIEKSYALKILQGAQAIPVAPEATDFLNRNPVQELFNYATNTFTTSATLTTIPSIYNYLNRYIVLSINGTRTNGASTEKYTHAIVFDTLLSRYGKLAVEHSFVFVVQESRETLALLNKQTRTIYYLSFDIYQTTLPFADVEWTAFTGVLVLGKFQYVRSRKIQLHEIQAEGPQNSAIIGSPNFSCVLLPSLNGRTFDTPVTPYQVSNSGGLAVYNCHATAQNHSIVLKGAFNLSTVQLKFSPRGDI